jgi:hypothetical protein
VSLKALITPILVPDGQPVELLAAEFPVGKELLHVGLKSLVVAPFEQMDQFMHRDVFEAAWRLAG